MGVATQRTGLAARFVGHFMDQLSERFAVERVQANALSVSVVGRDNATREQWFAHLHGGRLSLWNLTGTLTPKGDIAWSNTVVWHRCSSAECKARHQHQHAAPSALCGGECGLEVERNRAYLAPTNVSDTMSSSSAPDDCWCIDLCSIDDPDGADRFLASTRGVMIRDIGSPWHRYFGAVYNGRSPLPLDLGRINAFYLQTPAWRRRHPRSPSPFRDCARVPSVINADGLGKHARLVGTALGAGGHVRQPRCPAKRCAPWLTELRQSAVSPHQRQHQHQRKWWSWLWSLVSGRGASTPSPMNVVPIPWPRAWVWLHPAQVATGQRLVQLVSERTEEFGRQLRPNQSWVEVLRTDSRPWFQEGQRLPECIDEFWNRSTHERRLLLRDGRGPECFRRADYMGGGPHPVGCYARPVVGSGVWLQLGATVAGARSFGEYWTAASRISAHLSGVETIQSAFGDTTPISANRSVDAPVILVVRPECIGRRKGIKSCLPPGPMLRSGWHDLPCDCSDAHHPLTLWENSYEEARFRETFAKAWCLPWLPQGAQCLQTPPLPSKGMQEFGGIMSCKPREKSSESTATNKPIN